MTERARRAGRDGNAKGSQFRGPEGSGGPKGTSRPSGTSGNPRAARETRAGGPSGKAWPTRKSCHGGDRLRRRIERLLRAPRAIHPGRAREGHHLRRASPAWDLTQVKTRRIAKRKLDRARIRISDDAVIPQWLAAEIAIELFDRWTREG